MRRTLSTLRWFMVLIAHSYLITSVLSDITTIHRGKELHHNHVDQPQHARKTNKIERKLKKLPSIVDNAEKKSELEKKTSVSINGRLLPIAGLSQTDKTVHVTVKNANEDTINEANTPQTIVQEVVPQNGVALNNQQPAGQATVALPPPPPIIRQPATVGIPSAPGAPQEVMGMSPPQLPGVTTSLPAPPVLLVPQAARTMSSPSPGLGGTAQVAMSPPQLPNTGVPTSESLENAPDEETVNTVGHYPSSAATDQAQTLQPQTLLPQTLQPQTLQPQTLQPQTLQPQTLQPQTLQPQIQTLTPTSQSVPASNIQVSPHNGCNPATTNNLQLGGKLVHLSTNSEGQLTYKPLRC